MFGTGIKCFMPRLGKIGAVLPIGPGDVKGVRVRFGVRRKSNSSLESSELNQR